MIRRFDPKAAQAELPEVILEIANPTTKTFYVKGTSIEEPGHHVEVPREKRWLHVASFTCGTGNSMRPLKPGAKMLVTAEYPRQEPVARFRFFFYTAANLEESKVVSVRSRGIERKELEDFPETKGELASDVKLEEPVSDEEMNRPRTILDEGAADPFAE